MAKKTKSYSQVQATDALEQLGQHGTSALEFVYDLLRIFAGYGDGQVRRTKDGMSGLMPGKKRSMSADAKNVKILINIPMDSKKFSKD